MARQLRIEYAGAMYHVTVRSNGKQALFGDDEDRRYLLSRIAKACDEHNARIYLLCLMENHLDLVLETPNANLCRFMHGVLSGYGVYYNRRHNRHGHVTQGRYGSKLVEGNEYLLKLSRYIHLNPVRYRKFVEGGIREDDEEFQIELERSARSIGNEKFKEWVDDCYAELLGQRDIQEDVSFRRVKKKIEPEKIFKAVARAAGVKKEQLLSRRRDSTLRAVASRMLCRHGGLTQRDAARALGLRTGVAVSCQLRNLDTIGPSVAQAGRAT